MQSDAERRITRFVEKPKDESTLTEFKMSRELLASIGAGAEEELFQASMGIYVFNRDVLVACLENDLVDFGKHIIPQSIQERQVSGFIFNAYGKTRDILPLRIHLDLPDLLPRYSFLRLQLRFIPTRAFCPAVKINGATLRQRS